MTLHMQMAYGVKAGEAQAAVRVGNGSADRKMVCQCASTGGAKHITIHSGSLAKIFLIQIILIRNNGFVKRKIGNLFELKADDGKQSKRGERSFFC